MPLSNEPLTVEQEIGLIVKERRLQLNLSQEALGKAIGVSFQQIQKYEKGKNRISHSSLLNLAKVLKVDISYFTPTPKLEDFNFDKIKETYYFSDTKTEYDYSSLQKEVEELVKAFISIKDPETRKGFLTILKSSIKPKTNTPIKQKVNAK